MVEIVCVHDAGASLGEGTLWDPSEKVLWWIDIWERLIYRFEPATGSDRTWTAPEYLGLSGAAPGRRTGPQHGLRVLFLRP